MEKAKQATEEHKISEIKEELQIAVNSIQMEILEKSESITIDTIVKNLKENQTKYLRKNIEQLNDDGTDGKYSGYDFYIDNKTFEVILKNKSISEDVITSQKNKNYIIFHGSSYIDTGIQQEQLINTNQEFTIATSVYINRDMQSKINYMDILGNHLGQNGFVWQFYGTSSMLELYSNGLTIQVDYTPYYEKWTKIAMVYKNGTIKVYFDDQLIETKDNMTLIPYGNVLIGTGFLNEDRTMQGAIRLVKIWKKELSQEDINQINYDEKNTNIQKNYILKEINFNINEEIVGTVVGINYDLVSIEKEIDYEVKLLGGNLLDINLPESTILENSEFAIAARVKINSEEQKKITSMGILGNHNSTSGIVWQFSGISSILQIGIGTQSQMIDVDYTEYYDELIDIVMTYKDRTVSVYINNEKISEQENIDMVANGNIYIGSSYGNTNRGMCGYLPYVKIWNKALTENQIKNLKMDMDTDLETSNVLKELNLTKIDNFSNYGTLANNNYQLIMIGK